VNIRKHEKKLLPNFVLFFYAEQNKREFATHPPFGPKKK
jgi:hypothetical protein